jgi:hypothetical protein
LPASHRPRWGIPPIREFGTRDSVRCHEEGVRSQIDRPCGRQDHLDHRDRGMRAGDRERIALRHRRSQFLAAVPRVRVHRWWQCSAAVARLRFPCPGSCAGRWGGPEERFEDSEERDRRATRQSGPAGRRASSWPRPFQGRRTAFGDSTGRRRWEAALVHTRGESAPGTDGERPEAAAGTVGDRERPRSTAGTIGEFWPITTATTAGLGECLGTDPDADPQGPRPQRPTSLDSLQAVRPAALRALCRTGSRLGHPSEGPP